MGRTTVFYLLAVLAIGPAWAGGASIRIGVSPAILSDQQGTISDLRRYLNARTGRDIELIPRNSYRETYDLMRQEKLDFAWVSAYPYLYLQRALNARLLVAPLFHGRPFIRAYLIVRADAGNVTGLLDLEDKLFAFADPDSFTGHYLPRYELRQAGKDASVFFAKTFFARGQRNVVRAVASGLADGAYVHDFAWDALAEREPELTAGVRIVARSAEYGAPPIIARAGANVSDAKLLRRALLEMANDAEGGALLKRMHIDGFAVSDPKAYEGVDRIMREMGLP